MDTLKPYLRFENYFLNNKKNFKFLYNALNRCFTQLPSQIDINHEFYKFKSDDYLFYLNNKDELLNDLKNERYECFFNKFKLDVMLICGGKTGSSFFKKICIENKINIFRMTEGDWQKNILLFFGIPQEDHHLISSNDIFEHFKFKNNNLIIFDLIRLPIERGLSSFFYNNYYSICQEYDKKNNNNFLHTIKNDNVNQELFDEIIERQKKEKILLLESYKGCYPSNYKYFEKYDFVVKNNIKYVLMKYEDVDIWHDILSELFNKKIFQVITKVNSNESKPWGIHYKLFKNYIKDKIVYDKSDIINFDSLICYNSETLSAYYKQYS